MLERTVKKYILNKQVRLRHDEVSDKFYAFLIDSGDHFTLNKTGFTVLNFLNEGKSLDEIVELLSKKVKMDKNTILTDVVHFLELSEKNSIIAYM